MAIQKELKEIQDQEEYQEYLVELDKENSKLIKNKHELTRIKENKKLNNEEF